MTLTFKMTENLAFSILVMVEQDVKYVMSKTFSSNDNDWTDTDTDTHTHAHTHTHWNDCCIWTTTVIGTVSSDLKEVDFMTVRLYNTGGL